MLYTRTAEFEPAVITRLPSGVYVRIVVPGVSEKQKAVVSTVFQETLGVEYVRAGLPLGRIASEVMCLLYLESAQEKYLGPDRSRQLNWSEGSQ